MKKRLLIAIPVTILLAWGAWRMARTEPRSRLPGPPPESPAPPHIVSLDPPVAPTRILPVSGLNEAASPADDLRLVARIIENYRIMVKDPNGNPVGSNHEITRALMGRNRARLAWLPTNHPAVTPSGELTDRWGTPYFFHALGAQRMEIRSAGPDRRMWTGDDLVDSPKAEPAAPLSAL